MGYSHGEWKGEHKKVVYHDEFSQHLERLKNDFLNKVRDIVDRDHRAPVNKTSSSS